MSSAVVKAIQVSKAYGKFEAVKAIDFEVRQGEIFGLLGPNGAGKSSIISLLYGAKPRSGGSLRVFGLDPESDPAKLKPRIGVVPQANCLDTGLTVLENLEIFTRFQSMDRKLASERIQKYLQIFALEKKIRESVESLSGGMQRRLAFVRALLHAPDLLILDEPTTGLDPAVRRLLWDRVIELNKNGATVLLSTHYMEEAQRLCSRIVIMDQGKIAAEGSTQELLDTHKGAHLEDVFLKVTGRRLGVDE